MQGYLDKTVDKKTQGIIDELLVNIKKIQKIIKKVKFQTCTILVVLKSLYGTLKTSQLFWENLSGILNEWNLKTIPYAWFTAKKIPMLNNVPYYGMSMIAIFVKKDQMW